MRNKTFKLVIFDLDGTLIDSSQDIAVSVNLALQAFGLAPLPLAEVKSYIGRGTRVLMRKALHGDEELFSKAFGIFSEHYSRNLVMETKLYPGVLDTLKRISPAPMAVVSNKRQSFCDPIIDGLGLRKYFKLVYGGDAFERSKPHPLPLLKVCEKLAIDPKDAVMVGDSSIDVDAGIAAGMTTVGFLHGFGTEEEIRISNPTFKISSMEELLQTIRVDRPQEMPTKSGRE